MWCIRQRGPLFILCSSIFFIIFMVQLVTLYRNHQKLNRVEGYKVFMSEIIDTMSAVEQSANKTSLLIDRLQTIVSKDSKRKAKTRKIS